MTNEPYFLPFIARENYESFRRLPDSDLPDTYDEWFQLHAKLKLQWGQVGYAVENRQINLDEFIRFCSARGIAPNGDSLMKFAFGKGAGENY